ncbi:hypothetical protein SAMN04487995_4323 [Dyadobacter koreensis]|uniref:Uncharacterized protein n=1 Tax=Dyadobacter koreensis TaxID=408657 RepID=A0A1H6XZR1_9BACT|nr:hypothetical protein [Dyadobacter koreensis]SEJ34548.1 hypothetical protein SAMN04487995_4323 [Dyadobacter koreensis]
MRNITYCLIISFEFTEDEFVGILSWLKYFNDHYKQYYKQAIPGVMNPVVSKRLRLDFGLYIVSCDNESNRGKFVLYISENKTSGPKVAVPDVKSLINTWHL